MSNQANKQPPKMPKDAAQLVLWFKGLPQPTAFLTTREDAEQVIQACRTNGSSIVQFKSYPDGSGMRSESVFGMEDLRGVTIEYPTLQLAAVN